MTIEKAVKILHKTKGDIMDYAFGAGHSGIDSTLPQGYVDANDLAYGHAEPERDLFWYVVDCRHGCKIVDMRTVLDTPKYVALMLLADMLEYVYDVGRLSDKESATLHRKWESLEATLKA